MTKLSASLSHRQDRLKKFHSPSSRLDELFVHLPFSLYHGWTTILVVLTVFEAFGTDALKTPPGVWTKGFVFLPRTVSFPNASFHGLTNCFFPGKIPL